MLNENEVHIWQLKLPCEKSAFQKSYNLLSEDEKDRAAKYAIEEGRNNFIASRGTLRLILGKSLGLPPENIRFSYNPYGKPYLNKQEYPTGLKFNLSDTDGLAMYAFTLNHEIGIDIETIHEIKDLQEVATRFFSVPEVLKLKTVLKKEQDEAFLSCWTLKEAYIKAIGEGLSCPLDQFEMAFTKEEKPALLSVKWDEKEKDRWQMYRLNSPEGYIASLAIEGGNHRLVYKDFDGEFPT